MGKPQPWLLLATLTAGAVQGASGDLQTGRYTVLAPVATAAQADPLQSVVRLEFPRGLSGVTTVEAAVVRALTRSGYRLASSEASDPALRHERDPKLDAVKLAATAHFQLHRYEAAVPYLEKVLARQRPPEEAWYQMLLAYHFERNQYQAAVGLLETMVQTWPERHDYWLQWSGAYQRLDQNHQALAVLELAERRALLGEAERLQLVRLYAYVDMPYQAAEFLSAKIEQGAIKTNLDVWDLLAHSWAHAQEKQRAVRALEHAARLALDGNRYLHIAQLRFELRDWNGAVKAVDNALQKGDIKQVGTAHLLLGIASHHRGDEKSVHGQGRGPGSRSPAKRRGCA